MQRDRRSSAVQKIRDIAACIVISIISYAVGAAGPFWKPETLTYELANAFPPSGLTLSGKCVQPTDRDRALVKAAVDILAFSANDAGVLAIGAQKFLALGINRLQEKERIQVCDIAEEYERAGILLKSSRQLSRGRPVEYTLELIAKTPNPSTGLGTIVAESAFNDSAQGAELYSNRDIRPFARSTLATLGPLARPYANIAFENISIEDSMGTGAAQVAVAGKHPMALQRVETLMAGKLAAFPKDEMIPWEAKNRLYEMAYALARGGEESRQHLAPLYDLMKREVQQWAPLDGMPGRPPTRMCGVLATIVQKPASDLGYSYCAAGNLPIDR